MIELCWPKRFGNSMKKIGIVGGVGWQSTVDYYSHICRRSEERHLAMHLPGAPATPEIAIESLDHRKAISYLGTHGDEESWAQFDEYHRAALQRLVASGADFALIASNSPHHRFEAITRSVWIPVLNIFEVVAKESARMGVKEVLILGTALTMSSQKFREEFAKHGIEAAGPDDERARCRTIELISDLQCGKVEGAAERLEAIAKVAAKHQTRRVVCLACTDMPLAFPKLKTLASFEVDGILYLNTSVVHAEAAFQLALE